MMRITLFFAAMIVVVVTSVTCAIGQDAGQCSPGMRPEGSYGVNPKIGAPFSATAKISFEQKLSKENNIRGFARFRQARDSAGSTYNEVPQRCFYDEDGTFKLAYSINTYDIGLKTSTYWSVFGSMVGWQEGVAHVSHDAEQLANVAITDDVLHQRRQLAVEQWAKTGYKTEKLGLKTLLGISVVGSRTTRTIPAGKEGNELPLELIHEAWWSPELGQDLLVIDEDPRIGRTTYELEAITREEPDRAIFSPPASYVRKPVQAQ